MKEFLKKDMWSPYLVGALIGVLSWLTFYFSQEHIGTTLAYVKITAFFEGLFFPGHVESSEYYARYLPGKPLIGWQTIFVFAIFFGALFAAKLSGQKRVEHVPTLWVQNFGSSKAKRYLAAFVGGFLLLFGARIAGGCTSGQAISGGMQLALSGWLFIAAVFGGGIATSFALYRNREGR
jgi:hypothetical protein